MAKNSAKPESKRWILYLVIAFMYLNFSGQVYAQKNDYIVFGDTSQSDGYIKNNPIENNTAIFFKKLKREEYKKYSIQEVTEFYVNHRRFLKKNVTVNGSAKTVFLQLIPQPKAEVNLWKLSEDVDYYFLEDANGLNQFKEESYRQVLGDLLRNPILDPLIDITSLEEYSLIYLFQTATTIIKPRTFSRIITFSPYVGYSLSTQQFSISNSGIINRVTAKTPTIGANLEVFVNQNRDISVNISPSWSKVDTQEFLLNSEGKLNFETDYFLEYSVITFPILGKYYLDITPNQWRVYFELGYSFGFFNYNKLGYYQAEINENSVTTKSGDFELKAIYQGLVWGIGIEKYLKKSKALNLGIRSYHLNASSTEKYLNSSGYLGFKF